MTTTPTLTVYKASAGSGKTFTLTVKYIELLINNPMSYRNILAVTFTNKATGEMKQRILSQLYGIWKQLSSSEDYIKRITEDMKVTRQYASDRARLALHLIIYHYSYFRIQTIDTFFQAVLRNLARELDLTANLRVEINDAGVEKQAVDEMLYELKPDDKILRWILSYMREKMDNDEDWNVIETIKKFGENIFKAAYKSHDEELNRVLQNADQFRQFRTQVRSIIDQAEKTMVETGEKFLNILTQNGYDVHDFFNGKTGVCGYFNKLANGRFRDAKIIGKNVANAMESDNLDAWVAKTMKDKARQQQLYALVEGTLYDYLLQAEKKRQKAINDYASATSTLKNLNQLRLLHNIERKVRSMNAEANRFLLSDTQDLLHALIKDTDSPFVFEKIGTQLDNIMIDEFQDTSTVQWSNFKVLLEECMSHGNTGNLIVGDVKQSIYRWRDGDWRLLNNINGEFKDAASRLCQVPLKTNYRSTRRVIDFNNAFFTVAAPLESQSLRDKKIPNAELIDHAYNKEEVRQEIPSEKGDEGYVRVTMFTEDEEMDEVKRTIEQLQEANVPLNKIAILARTNIGNKGIAKIAEYITQEMPEIKLVSDEAFRLDSSLATKVIVTAMHFLTHPDDKLAEAYLAKAYRKYIKKETTDDNEIFMAKDEAEWLPARFINEREELIIKPVYDLAEDLYDIFELNLLEGQTAYLCAFYDQLLAFQTDNSSDIDDFVKAWETYIGEGTICANDTNGIRILTIHKSKGLEFEYVIVPYCDWSLSSSQTILWCTSEKHPYSTLPVIPITGQPSKLKDTVYEADYQEETLQNTVDNLNLLYVAFTRAEKGLFIIGKSGDDKHRADLIERTLPLVAKELGSENVTITEDEGKRVFEYGELLPYTAKSKKKDHRNVFNPQIDRIEVSIGEKESQCSDGEKKSQRPDFKQSNQSKEFVHSDEEDEKGRYIKTGKLLHKLFSCIRTTDDAEQAILQMEQDGLLSESTISPASLRKMLAKRWETPQVRDWFSPRWQVLNECTILSFDEKEKKVKERRPDRVMTDGKEIVVVDFKFGTPYPKYESQVREYMQLLRDMGHERVRGYLWFVYTNSIQEVK